LRVGLPASTTRFADSKPQTRSYLLYATAHTIGTGAVLGEMVAAAPALKQLFDLTAYVFSTCLDSVALLFFAMVYCDRTDLLSRRSVRGRSSPAG
jgi:hypothetical protein